MRTIGILFAALAVSVSLPNVAAAATLFLTPTAQTIRVGDVVDVSVLVNSGGVAINNAEGSLVFPVNLFEVVSVSTSPSLFSLWIQSPTYNGSGVVAFNGGLPSPGYQGENGALFRVRLRALNAGSASIAIQNGIVRANDGYGTDVATGSGSAVILVNAATPAATPEATTPTAKTTNVSAPVITSPTHPSQSAWYGDPQATLTWVLPNGSDQVQTLLSKTQGATPTVLYRSPITKKTLDPLPDGTWYFNLRAHSAAGWGPVVSYQLNIDRVAPTLQSLLTFDATSSTLLIQAAAQDEGSGVVRYEVSIDGGNATRISLKELTDGYFSLPIGAAAGEHSAQVSVYDAAGNHAESSVTRFTVIQPASLHNLLWARVKAYNYGRLLLPLALGVSFVSLMLNLLLWRELKRLTVSRKTARKRSVSE